MACDMEIECLYILCVSLLVSTEISFIVGSMTHVYIIAVNVIDWRKGRTMSTSDQVIISIMISRMILQSVIQLSLFCELFCTISSPIYDLVMQIIFCSSAYSSIWLSTLLCVIFYLKISNIHSVFSLWLRNIFSKRILRFVMACLLVSIGPTSVIFVVDFATGTDHISLNSTLTTQSMHDTISAVFYVNMFGSLFIFVLASLFLITSLSLHIKHMRCNRNVTGSLDPYYKIIKYTAGSIFITTLCVIITVAEESLHMFGFILFSFSWTTFGTLHSILLIYATPKLKDPLSRILKYLSNCWIKREEPGDFAMADTI